MTASSLDALATELGGEWLERHADIPVDGVAVGATLRPPTGEDLARSLAALSTLELAALPRGGGTRADLGNPPARADVLISTAALAGVDAFEPGEGVCHALAGTPLAVVREAVGPRWELPLDGDGPASTVGGALAVATPGPRAHGWGPTRDAVLGLEVALATGERTRCGGRVVKNVTGYDLAKLYTGSLGTLGVIEGAWLRLRPTPECVVVLESAATSLAEACVAALDARARATTRACALVGGNASGFRTVVELAGAEPGVERDATELRGRLDATPANPEAIENLARRQAAVPEPAGLRFRIPVRPARFGEVLAALCEAGAEVVAHPGQRLVWALFPLEAGPSDAARADAAFAAADAAARASKGAALCEAAPPEWKRGRDVFGPAGDAAPLFRALKQRFDPGGVLNPGRFAGGL